MKKRYRSGRISIDVYVSEVIDAISDEVLVEEVNERGLNVAANSNYEVDVEAELHEAYEALVIGRAQEARAILERLIDPKWKSEKACEEAYKAAKKASA